MSDLKYKVGDIVELKEPVDELHFCEIIEVHPDDMFLPYKVCAEGRNEESHCSWIAEHEIECLIHSADEAKEEVAKVREMLDDVISRHIKVIVGELLEIVKEIENYGRKEN